MSLQNPAKKMSKSDPDPRSRILITDTTAEIHKKIMGALTDSTNAVSYEPEGRPAVSNLLELWSQFDEEQRTPKQLAEELRGAGLKTLKQQVAEAVTQGLNGVGERYNELLVKESGRYIDKVQEECAASAAVRANETMENVRSRVGLL